MFLKNVVHCFGERMGLPALRMGLPALSVCCCGQCGVGDKIEIQSKKMQGGLRESTVRKGGLKNKNKNPPLWVPPSLMFRGQKVFESFLILNLQYL